MKMYSVYDSKAQSFGRPFFYRNRGEALRAWEDVVNMNDTPMNAHPGDFTLFEIGQFDEFTGKVTPRDAFESLGLAVEVHHRSRGEMQS